MCTGGGNGRQGLGKDDKSVEQQEKNKDPLAHKTGLKIADKSGSERNPAANAFRRRSGKMCSHLGRISTTTTTTTCSSTSRSRSTSASRAMDSSARRTRRRQGRCEPGKQQYHAALHTSSFACHKYSCSHAFTFFFLSICFVSLTE